MFFLLTPILNLLLKAGTFRVVAVIKEHLICWLIVAMAALFALLFLNICLYVFLSVHMGAIFAALLICLLWLIIGTIAAIWANSNYSRIKSSTSEQIAEFTHKQRDVLLPLVLTVLPILKQRKKILKTVGVIAAGGTAAWVTKLIRRCK